MMTEPDDEVKAAASDPTETVEQDGKEAVPDVAAQERPLATTSVA